MFEPRKTKERPDLFKKIYEDAVKAGLKAHTECKPIPVSWVSVDLFDKPLDKPSELDLEGDCGGAYVVIQKKLSTGRFLTWCDKNTSKLGEYTKKGFFVLRMDYGSYRGQSAERAEACARAFAEVLKKHEIPCSVKTYLS